MVEHPTGVARVERGDCPLGAHSIMGCMFCSVGHMLECHHPHSCEEANCSHNQEMEAEAELYPPEEEIP